MGNGDEHEQYMKCDGDCENCPTAKQKECDEYICDLFGFDDEPWEED